MEHVNDIWIWWVRARKNIEGSKLDMMKLHNGGRTRGWTKRDYATN